MMNKKGITLIALVITIIILLILAGISITALTRSGLFEKAKLSKEESEKAQIKEEIEMAIMEIQIEEIQKGNNVTLETLSDEENGQLVNKLDNITAKLNDNEINGEYKGYKYKIDNDLKVTIGDPIKGISFNYILNPNGYTNGNIKLTVNAESTNGNITNINIAGLNRNADGTFTITENGDYEVTVTDSTGDTKTETLSIQKIDKVKPVDFTIEASDIKATSFTITALNVRDGEDEKKESATSGIERYEYWVNGECYNSDKSSYTITGLNKNTTYTVYVKVFDKANNDTQSNTIYPKTTPGEYPTLTLKGMTTIDAAEDALNESAYDRNVDSAALIGYEGDGGMGLEQYFKIDEECWGKYITFYHQDDVNSPSPGYLCFKKGKSGPDTWGGFLNSRQSKICDSIKIPEGSYWGMFATGQSAAGPVISIYEVWCSEQDLSGNVYTNQNLPY